MIFLIRNPPYFSSSPILMIIRRALLPFLFYDVFLFFATAPDCGFIACLQTRVRLGLLFGLLYDAFQTM